MKLSITTIEQARHYLERLRERFQSHTISSKIVGESSDEPIDIIIAEMNQFFDIVDGVDAKKNTFAANDISDIGEHGISLLEKLKLKADSLQLVAEKDSLEQIVLVVADWIIERDGNINLLEPIVDALAQVANATQDQQQLIALAEFMGEIADACSDAIKHDLEITNMHRPWRMLNINRGIVATRTYDPNTMRNVFSMLIKALPMDAPAFFKEGMSEMVRLNYPDHARDVIHEFYEKTEMPLIH